MDVQPWDMTQSDSDATDSTPAAAQVSEEPGKKHGDPLLAEAEGTDSSAAGADTSD